MRLSSSVEWAKRSAEETLAEASDLLSAAGVEHETLLLDGAPAAALAQATDDKAVDLIVVGHRGLGALKRIVLGSVSARPLAPPDNRRSDAVSVAGLICRR